MNQNWTYKNHTCEIVVEDEGDVRKAYHRVTLPNGSRLSADINPYDTSDEAVQYWIDACYPLRGNRGAPWTREELAALPKPIQVVREDKIELIRYGSVDVSTTRPSNARKWAPAEICWTPLGCVHPEGVEMFIKILQAAILTARSMDSRHGFK